MKLNKTLSTLLVAGSMLTAGAANAAVFLDFTVDPSAYSAGDTSFVADKITGNYIETITLGAGTFDVSLLWNAGQFVANDGATPIGGFTTGLGNNYQLYGTFLGSGTWATVGGITTFTLSAGNPGDLNIWLDPLTTETTFPGATTTWAQNGSTLQPVAGNADDILIATGTGIAGQGTLDPNLSTCDPGINCGSFGQSTTFALTSPDGTGFFTLPNPFYSISFQSGQLNNFALSGTQFINGSMDAVFAVPEPTSIALIGLALLGLGFTQRRKS